MTTPSLGALLKIAEAATPGPWLKSRLPLRMGDGYDYGGEAAVRLGNGTLAMLGSQQDADAAHIAAFNPTVAQALVEGMKVLEELADRYAGDDGLDRAMKEGIDAEIIGARAALSALTLALKGRQP